MLARIKLASFALTLLLCLFVPSFVHALDVPPVPTDTPIVDQTNTLTVDQKTKLAEKIANERKQTGNQIGILIISSLQGEAIEEYSLKVARQWGVGTEERNNGVLLLVAKEDRQLRIEVGYGLEGALTDARSAQIIRDRITPKFREGKYYEGIDAGLDGITKAIHGEADPSLRDEEESGSESFWFGVFIYGLFSIPAWIASMLARSKSWWAGGLIGGVLGLLVLVIFGIAAVTLSGLALLIAIGLLFDKLVSDNYRMHKSDGTRPSWWAGGGGFGRGSGGFGGFGGGGFGGGGAGGRW